MDLVAALGTAVVQAPLGPAGSFARHAFGASTDKEGTSWGPATSVVTTAPASTPASARESSVPAASPGKGAMLGALLGVSIGTIVAGGVGYGLGRWLYPDTGGVPFAKVGAIGYLIPVGLWMGLSAAGTIGSGARQT
jgi:hypothetical protein